MSLTSGEHGGDEAVRAEARGGGGGQGQILPGLGDRVKVPRDGGTPL